MMLPLLVRLLRNWRRGQIGFNVSRDSLRQLIEAFYLSLMSLTGIFYFAGHGIQGIKE